MQVDKKKLERQFVGVNAWRKADGKGTLNWVTGMGKTYAACIIINGICDARPEGDIIVAVPSQALERQWKAEVKHLVKEQHQSRIEIYVKNTLSTYEQFDAMLLIVDEIHEFVSEEHHKCINGTVVNYKYVLGLTATWEDQDGRHKLLESIAPIVDVIGEEEAIEKGWISKFLEYNLAVELTEAEQQRYDYLSEIIGELFPKFNGRLDIASTILTGGTYKDSSGNEFEKSPFQYAIDWAVVKGWKPNMNFLDERNRKIDDLWNPKKIIGYAKSLFEAIRNRGYVVHNAKNKVDATIRLLKKFEETKTICFGQSTKFADRLGEAYEQSTGKKDYVVYHSQLKSRPLKDDLGNWITYKTGKNKGNIKLFGKKTLLDRATEQINNGSARVIFTSSALDRGFDVRDLRMGITTSGTRNPTKYKQRGGRVKRIESYEEDIMVVLINIYIPHTVDQSSLNSRQKTSKNVVIWVNSIDEINYSPKAA